MSSWRIVLRALAVDRTVLAVGAVAVLVTALALAVSGFPRVGTPFGNEIVPWPLLPCFPALLLTMGVRGSMATIERASARGPLVPSAVRLAVLVLAIAVAAAAVSDRAPTGTLSGHGTVAWRNAALVTGIALLSSVRPGALSWLPATALVIVTATVGAPPGTTPPDWSLLLRSGEDVLPSVVAGALLAAGLVAIMISAAPRRARPVPPSGPTTVAP